MKFRAVATTPEEFLLVAKVKSSPSQLDGVNTQRLPHDRKDPVLLLKVDANLFQNIVAKYNKGMSQHTHPICRTKG